MPVVAAVIALVGALIGAGAALTGQLVVARNAREAALFDARRAAVLTLLSRVDVVLDAYSALDHSIETKQRVSSETEARANSAWNDYQLARAPVRLSAPEPVNDAGGAMKDALVDWVNSVEGREAQAARNTKYGVLKEALDRLNFEVERHVPMRPR